MKSALGRIPSLVSDPEVVVDIIHALVYVPIRERQKLKIALS